jgi:hypothetical protein
LIAVAAPILGLQFVLVRPISFATPTKNPSPSFLIPGAAKNRAAASLRLDLINSSLVIQAARRVLFQALDLGGSANEPSGVVLNGCQIQGTGQDLGKGQHFGQGRIVFDQPVLLPDEHFVPIELIRGRVGRSGTARLRLPRKPSAPPLS